MKRLVLIVNGFQLLTIITRQSILDVAAALDPPLVTSYVCIPAKLISLKELTAKSLYILPI